MKSSEIREQFLKYFEKKGHKRLPSASLVPTDPTVLLTLAGMLPFKPIFLGIESPKYKRVTTVQKCIRMNDIEHVGHTSRHHTFFEMLGNFSFGDYFKEDAIAFAWELLTEGYKIDKNRLVIAIYEKDDEAADLWSRIVPKEKIYRLDAENNFWAAGKTGPCGPCSEIYYDYGGGCGKPECNPACECERFLEIWNLVFIQFNRDEKGDLLPLPKKNIDTGMGLERIARVLQGKRDNFETDLFAPIFSHLPDMSPAAKIVADHLRAMTYLIADGVIPSNEGRGYVLRRIIRRAAFFGRKLKMKTPFLFELAKIVIDSGKDTYPELKTRAKATEATIKAEELNFGTTLEAGMKMLDELFAKHKDDKRLSGAEVFELHDTYGFPSQTVYDIASESEYQIDFDGFNKLMEEQRTRARAKSQKAEETVLRLKNIYEEKLGITNFIGYEKLETEAKILEMLPAEKIVILDKTPFYPESGGQIGDTGIINESLVAGTYGEINGIIFHKVDDVAKLKIGANVKVKVDAGKRKDTTAHHTATHLLQSALRKVLGEGVRQAGSAVHPDRLRFDFNFSRAMTQAEIEAVEKIVNDNIKLKIKVEKFEESFEEAKKMGATALFSEKYGDRVRVVRIKNVSLELCGGCHVNNTSEIGFFKIVKEEALQAGIRRIEAVAGQPAKVFVIYKGKGMRDEIGNLMKQNHLLQAKEELLGGIKPVEEDVFSIEQTELEALFCAVDEKDSGKVNKFLEHLKGRVDWLKERNKTLLKEINGLEAKQSLAGTDKLLSAAEEIKGIKVIKASLTEISINNLRSMGDKLRDSLKSGIILLASTVADKVMFLVIVTDDLVAKGHNAGKLAKILSETCGGGGGGRANKAEAGGRDASKIDEAFQKAIASL